AASFSDSQGCGIVTTAPYRYRWALVLLPPGSQATLDDPSAANPMWLPDVPGDYQVAAQVSDALGATLPTRFFVVHVESCGINVPQVAISPISPIAANTLQTVPLSVLGTPSNADTDSCPSRFAVASYSYAWSVSPAGASLMETVGSTTHFVAGSPGTYTVSLVATGSNGISSAPATQTVTVAPCGSHAPYVASVDVAP